jgi:hypothetical protein
VALAPWGQQQAKARKASAAKAAGGSDDEREEASTWAPVAVPPRNWRCCLLSILLCGLLARHVPETAVMLLLLQVTSFENVSGV